MCVCVCVWLRAGEDTAKATETLRKPAINSAHSILSKLVFPVAAACRELSCLVVTHKFIWHCSWLEDQKIELTSDAFCEEAVMEPCGGPQILGEFHN